MKKFFTLAVTLASCICMNAEVLKTITLGEGTPGFDEPQLSGLGISADGKYICGSIDFGEGGFVMNVADGQYCYEYVSDTELRKVDNNGVSLGYMGDLGVTYSCSGEITELKVPSEDYKYIIGEDITNDGSVMVGSLIGAGFVTYAAYSVNGGEWTMLPMPPAEILELVGEGSSAKFISGDGKYIVGHAGSFGPVIMWTRGDDGSYTVDALFNRYCASDASELAEKPLVNLTPSAISNNGEHVLCYAQKLIIDEDGGEIALSFPAVYETATGELKLYDEPQDVDDAQMGLMGSAIADDGTFIGIIGNVAFYGSMGCFVMKAGETQAVSFLEAFPEYGAKFEIADMGGMSVPTDMSADGSSILGYAFYADDYYDDESPAYFLTYIIETGFGGSAAEAVEAASGETTVYSLDGIRQKELKKGINIVRMPDGSVLKIIGK